MSSPLTRRQFAQGITLGTATLLFSSCGLSSTASSNLNATLTHSANATSGVSSASVVADKRKSLMGRSYVSLELEYNFTDRVSSSLEQVFVSNVQSIIRLALDLADVESGRVSAVGRTSSAEVWIQDLVGDDRDSQSSTKDILALNS